SHRISQRAIDNLSSLGGASGLLSRSFLSFFETFRYDKIGLSCKLKNNTCHMSGVEAKGDSYYIVKGGGIPRIDVMGFQKLVNWQVLTSRLKAIQHANEAIIE
ncbi:MAG: C4-dicarboxylate ABC transporter, partial [Gammaproteobacteria bacterium]|nr:C4-dicarboxylate ABC transporter [Gammaproteobacteria bacterium]